MTEQTINELADFFRTFKQGETKQPPQSNLTYDDAVIYFFRNMEVRGLIWKYVDWQVRLNIFIGTNLMHFESS